MKNILPSRTVIAFVLIPAVTVISLIALYSLSPALAGQEADEENALARAIETGNAQFQELDTDNDGLKDWEEFLYQTDETNPDTDGDGSSDGSEVARGYDPLVPGVGTSTELTATTSEGLYFYKQDKTLTKTDVLSRDTFTAYLQLRKSGALSEKAIVEDTLDRTIRENTEVDNSIEFTLTDLNTTSSTPSSRRSYKNSYQAATQTLQALRYDELELFAQFLYNDDDAAFRQIAINRDIYQKFNEALLSMSVPEDVAPIHLELVNNIAIAIRSLDGIINVEEDPLNSLVLAQKFDEDRAIILKNTQALKLYFTSNGL